VNTKFFREHDRIIQKISAAIEVFGSDLGNNFFLIGRDDLREELCISIKKLGDIPMNYTK
jgi:hypothetical protein